MLLKRGTFSKEVEILQGKLGLEVDGDFGPITESAVKKWQKSQKLPETGTITEKEWSILFPKVNLEKLRGKISDSIIEQIPSVMEKFKIDTSLRLAHFLSQCAHESGKFSLVYENLNYTKSGLQSIFPRYFPGNLAESYAKRPEMIASRVYGNRMGNGAEQTKDGWKFRGRGYIQLTGKENYKLFDGFVEENILEDPDLVATKYPLLSAAWFFHRAGLNEISDKGATDSVITAVTKRINGGTNGLEDRKKYFKEFYNLLK
jgi:putative chitinase